MRFTDKQRELLSYDPSDYSYKRTLKSSLTSWTMVYYVDKIEMDVLIRVYHVDHSRSSKIYEHTRHLLPLRSEYLLSPEKVFHWSGELWLIFPYCQGRTLNDVLQRHFIDGIT